jgi:hypothetical protein
LKAISELTGSAPAPTFEMWWAIYPRKQGSKAAIEKKFDALSKLDKSACYLGTTRHLADNPQWRDKQYVPMPATFLNQKRWGDEIVQTLREEIKKSSVIGGMADKVWEAMVEMYGDQWIKKHGDKPGELWVKFLKPLPEHRIKRGLRATLTHHKEFPPSLPAFIAHCSETFGEQHPAALPKPPGDQALALESIEKMKQILGVT